MHPSRPGCPHGSSKHSETTQGQCTIQTHIWQPRHKEYQKLDARLHHVEGAVRTEKIQMAYLGSKTQHQNKHPSNTSTEKNHLQTTSKIYLPLLATGKHIPHNK
eukprot:15365414-Ditylum_brightwellii.AAC.2